MAGPIKKTALTEQRIAREAMGVTDQNGYNPLFYRAYDEKGRVAHTKEGITTIPTEMTPREGRVERDLTPFTPKIEDGQSRPRNFKTDDGKDRSTSVGVQGRNVPIRGETDAMLS